MVDAVRTKLAAHGAAPHGDDLMAIDDEERCAAEERRQKRRQKRKGRKRAGKAQVQLSASAASAAAGGGGGRAGGKATVAVAVKSTSSSGAASESAAVLGRCAINGSAAGAASAASAAAAAAAASSSTLSAHKLLHNSNTESKNTAAGPCESRGVKHGGRGGGRGGARGSTAIFGKEKEGAGGAEAARACMTAGLVSGVATKVRCFGFVLRRGVFFFTFSAGEPVVYKSRVIVSGLVSSYLVLPATAVLRVLSLCAPLVPVSLLRVQFSSEWLGVCLASRPVAGAAVPLFVFGAATGTT